MYYNLPAIIPVIYRFSVRISFHSQQHLEPFTLRRVHSDSKIFAFGFEPYPLDWARFWKEGKGMQGLFFLIGISEVVIQAAYVPFARQNSRCDWIQSIYLILIYQLFIIIYRQFIIIYR